MPSPDESNIEPKEIARARILALIKDNEITDIEFEVSMGLKPTTVSNWKRKGSASFIDNLPKIAQYFGVTTDWLLGNEVIEMIRLSVTFAIPAVMNSGCGMFLPRNR